MANYNTTNEREVAFMIACGHPYTAVLIPDSGDHPIFNFKEEGSNWLGTATGEGMDESRMPVVEARLDPESVIQALDWAREILPAIRFMYLARQFQLKGNAVLNVESGAGKTSHHIFASGEKKLDGILLPWPNTTKAWKATREMGQGLGVFGGDNGIRFFEAEPPSSSKAGES